MKKRWIAFILTAVMVVGLLPAMTLPAAAASAPTKMWVEPTEMNGIPAVIDVFKGMSGGSPVYQIYLPGNVTASNCFLSWDGGATATVNGVSYASGECPLPPLETNTTIYSKWTAHTTAN